MFFFIVFWGLVDKWGVKELSFFRYELIMFFSLLFGVSFYLFYVVLDIIFVILGDIKFERRGS